MSDDDMIVDKAPDGRWRIRFPSNTKGRGIDGAELRQTHAAIKRMETLVVAHPEDDALELNMLAIQKRWQIDRREHDLALHDAISETSRTADELAFWRYQAIFARAYMLRPAALHAIDFEGGPEWKEAERQLEANRAAENRERYAHAEAPRDPGGT